MAHHYCSVPSTYNNAAQRSCKQRVKEGRHQGKGRPFNRQEKEEEKEGILQHLHLQGVEAGASRYWSVKQGYVYHEQLCERYLREDRS